MKRNILLLVLLLFFCLFVLLFVLFQLSRPIQKSVVQAHVIVDKGVGFNLETDKLYFGRVFPGGTSKRSINVSSPTDAILVVSTTGEIASWMYLQTNVFSLKANVPVDLPFTVTVPNDASFGNYTANITFTFYNPFMKRFIPVATGLEKNKTFK